MDFIDGTPRGTVNLAPYSFFNAVAYRPPQVMFAATTTHSHGGLKDSIRNAQDTGEFVVNLATLEASDAHERLCRARAGTRQRIRIRGRHPGAVAYL